MMNDDYLADSKRSGAISQIIARLVAIEKAIRDHSSVQHKPFTLAAFVYNTGNLNVNNATNTPLTFNTEVRDDGGFFNPASSTSRFTIPVTGWYQINGCASWAPNAAGIRSVFIALNGAVAGTFIVTSGLLGSASTYANTHVCSTVYYLTAGQYVELCGYQNSGGPLNINAYAIYSPSFSIHLVK